MSSTDIFSSFFDASSNNILKIVPVIELDYILTNMEKSYIREGLDEKTITDIMNKNYRILILDAIHEYKPNRLKYFINKYYENERINIKNYYHQSYFYFHIYDYNCGTDKLLPLLKVLIKQQIKNSIEHDDYNCGCYDNRMHPAFIKYLYNIGYITKDLKIFFERKFDCNKLGI